MGITPHFDVQVLKVGECDVPGPEVYWMDKWRDWVTLNFLVVVIRNEDLTLVINSGPPSDLTELNQRWGGGLGDKRAEMRRTNDERIENALAKVNVDPATVDYLLLTPLQIYATANIPLFAKATICISRRGWIEDYFAPKMPLHVPRHLRVSDDVMKHLLFEAHDRVRLLEDEDEIVPGVRAFWAGTHHRSSVAYAIETKQGTVIVSDCAFTYGNLEGDGHPLGIAESLEEGHVAYTRMRKEGDILIPLYEPEVFTRFPGGVITHG